MMSNASKHPGNPAARGRCSAPQQTREQEYEAMLLHTIDAADRDRRIIGKAKFHFIHACIRVEAVDISVEESNQATC